MASATCTFSVGEWGSTPHSCGKPAAARVKFLTPEQKRFGTVYYCLRHYRAAEDLLRLDKNRLHIYRDYRSEIAAPVEG
jgi:hypothetical protein